MEATGTTHKRKPFGKALLIFLLGAGLLAALGAGVSSLLPGSVTGAGEKLALVEISGPIGDSSEIVRQLAMYRRDEGIRGIILRVDSPGGAVAPSQEIYDEVVKARESGKLIYASLGNTAASGGYYIASPADRIFANPGTLTGSIGVIMAFSNVEELIGKIGLRPEVIKGGKFKDTGSPVRAMSPEERKLLQDVVDDVHKQFIEAVAKGRNMDIREIEKIADGRILTGRQAYALKLVDELGGLEKTTEQLAEKLGITGLPKIIQEKKPVNFLQLLMESSISKFISQSITLPFSPSLQYLLPLNLRQG